jgi:hypothetical protein
MLAEKGSGLGGPFSDHLEGPVWELRVRLHQVAVRVRDRAQIMQSWGPRFCGGLWPAASPLLPPAP